MLEKSIVGSVIHDLLSDLKIYPILGALLRSLRINLSYLPWTSNISGYKTLQITVETLFPLFLYLCPLYLKKS